MRKDGFHDDLRADVSRESLARLASAPEFADDMSEVEQTWKKVSEDMPIVGRQIARIALRYSGNDPELRGKITNSLVSLYIVLRDGTAMADFQEEIASMQLSSKSEPKPFDQDIA